MAAFAAPAPAHSQQFKHGTPIPRAESVKHERHRLWRERYKPFRYPDGRYWAVPYPIAWCESGGNYYVGPYGAYGLILEDPWLPPRTQDKIAHRLYLEHGDAPWAPFESGCMYR